MSTPNQLSCECPAGTHLNTRNYCEAGAERDGHVCSLGWPLGRMTIAGRRAPDTVQGAEDGKTPRFEETIARLEAEVVQLTRRAAAWREILDAVDYEARRAAICRTCPSNECQIRELCTSATACRSLYTLAAVDAATNKKP